MSLSNIGRDTSTREKTLYPNPGVLGAGPYSKVNLSQNSTAATYLREPAIVFSDDQSSARVSEETLRRVGFHDVDETVIGRVLPASPET